MPKKAFLEITNACNLSCNFCHGTKRATRFMTIEEFTVAATRLRSFADYLYFHVLGEPLLHPDLSEFLRISDGLGFKVILTTNGTLLYQKSEILLNSPALRKVSISLHCYEANLLDITVEQYLDRCLSFCSEAAQHGIVTVLRLWNIGGEDNFNAKILRVIHEYFPKEWKETYSGYKIAEWVFLEWGEKFDWPDIEAESVGGDHSCYGLRDQVGVLCDGTVVPCCLDADGVIALGNIFEAEIGDIISSPRAVALKNSFITKNVCEELCTRCGYAAKRMPKK